MPDSEQKSPGLKAAEEIMSIVEEAMSARNLTVDDCYSCTQEMVMRLIVLKHDYQKALIHRQIGAVPLTVEKKDD